MFYSQSMLWSEDAPTHCPSGHELGPGHSSNLDRGHRVHICRQCNTIMPWTPRSRLM